MKCTLVFMGVVACMLGGATPALADRFAVNADMPLVMSYNSKLHTDNVLGYILGLSTPFFVGFAVESYEVSGTSDLPGGQSSGFTETVNFTDIHVDLPFPAFSLSAGMGRGTGALDLERSGSARYEKAPLDQVFATVGIPVAPLLDVHLGYRVISGWAEKSSGASKDANLSGYLLSIGVKLGL